MGMKELTDREREILVLIAHGHDAEICCPRTRPLKPTVYERLRKPRENWCEQQSGSGAHFSRGSPEKFAPEIGGSRPTPFPRHSMKRSIAEQRPIPPQPLVWASAAYAEASEPWTERFLAASPTRGRNSSKSGSAATHDRRFDDEASSAFVAICLGAMLLSNLIDRG